MNIAKSIGQQLLRLISLLLGITLLTFALLQLSPLDPIGQYISRMPAASEAQIAALRKLWNQDLPWWEQYFKWLGSVLQGDWGTSYAFREPVGHIMSRAFKNSLLLMACAWVLSTVVGYLLGMASAVAGRGKKSRRWLDGLISGFSLTLWSTPTFIVGLLLIMIFAVWLGWSPTGLSQPLGTQLGEASLADRLRHIVLPCLAVSAVSTAHVALHTRQEFLDFLDSDVAKFARARGMGTWELIRNHGIRNTALPAVMLQFAQFATLFGGSLMAEVVFSYAGLGSAITEAGLNSDVPLLLGCVVLMATFVFVGNLIADILAKVIDPRVRRSLDTSTFARTTGALAAGVAPQPAQLEQAAELNHAGLNYDGPGATGQKGARE